MQIILPKLFFLFVAFRESHAAVSWRSVGCENWSFKDTPLDTIWTNAELMATNAQEQLRNIPTSAAGMATSKEGRRAGANAKFMFDIPWNKLTGTDEAGRDTINHLSSA